MDAGESLVEPVDSTELLPPEMVRLFTAPKLPPSSNEDFRKAITGRSSRDPEETLMDARLEVSRG
jgi:hypothetical protein